MRQHLTLGLLICLALLLAACQRLLPAPIADRLALHIDRDGIYHLTRADLLPFGWDLAKLDSGRLQLTHNDRVVPFVLVGNGAKRQLRFLGQTSPPAVYYLTPAPNAPPQPDKRRAPPTDLPPSTQATGQLQFEKNTIYLPQTRAHGRTGDAWLDQRLLAPGAITTTLTVPAPSDGSGELTIRLWSATEAPATPDHHLVYLLNEQPLGESTWDGIGLHTDRLTIPPGLLHPGDNTLLLQAPGDTAALADMTYLDRVELSYPRTLTATHDALSFFGSEPSHQLSGFSTPDIELWDATDLIRLTDFAVARTDDSYQVTFSDSPGAHHYIAASAPAFLTPILIRAAPPILPPPQGADYIVIAHPSLIAATQPLLVWRQNQGLRTAVVATDQIADQFGHGIATPDAVRAFLRWAVAAWPAPAPRFLLLAGDASYDRDPTRNLVPTALVPTQELGETASDTALADLDDDSLPDLAVGRLPARTPAQMQTLVSKTLAYEQQTPPTHWQQRLLLIADDDDPFFRSFDDEMAPLFPTSFSVTTLTIGDDADVRSSLKAAFESGQELISYMGHGAIDLWAQEEILRNEDIAALDQGNRLPFVVVWACLNGYFHHPQQTSLGETLILTPNKGAVAVLAPTGETYALDQRLLAQALFGRHLFTQPTLGEALLASYRQLDPTQPGQRDVLHTFALLGDPALRTFAK